MKKILVLLFVFISCFFIGCNNNEQRKSQYKITFEENGGTIVEDIYLNRGDVLVLPTIENEKARFEGWFLNEQFTILVDDDFIVHSDITLYAKWEYPDYIYADSYEIAFILEGINLKDKAFNQGTWEGVKKFALENDITYRYYELINGINASDIDRYNTIVQAIENGAKIIVATGFMQASALMEAAQNFKDVKFIFVDGWSIGLDNVTAVTFKEEQSGYLAGYAAVMEGYTKLGFSGGGGGTNPYVQRFGYGYIQGANDAAKAKGINIEMNYSWQYGAAFAASPELKDMLASWYSFGTEVIFVCGDTMRYSAFAAAAEHNGKVIGADYDQSFESISVITSAMKGLKEGILYALDKIYSDKWNEIANININLGAENEAVYLPTDTWKFTNFSIEEYEKLLEKIKNGEINVDNEYENAEIKKYSNVIINYIR